MVEGTTRSEKRASKGEVNWLVSKVIYMNTEFTNNCASSVVYKADVSQELKSLSNEVEQPGSGGCGWPPQERLARLVWSDGICLQSLKALKTE